MQGGVKNYLPSKMVTVPKKAKSSKNHPATELAYITKAEKDLLIKKDLHNSLKGKPNKGPGGVISLNGDYEDMLSGVTGADISAAERGEGPRGAMKAQDAQDLRSAAIAAGAGQRVNPGFFDSRDTVSPEELALARAFNPTAFRQNRRGGIMDLFTGGGFLGNIIRGIGQKAGLGKRFDQPTYDMRQFSGINPTFQDDLNNELLEQLAEEDNTQTITFDPTRFNTRNKSSLDLAGNIVYDERLGFIDKTTGEPVDTTVKGAEQTKTFNTKEDLVGMGAAKDSFFDTLTPEGKALEKFRKSAVGFKNAPKNTANDPQSALNFMLERPGLYGDIIENKDFIQGAIDKGFLETEQDYTDQLPLGKAVDLADGGRAGFAEGGIMDLETGRQMYFLGKLVKKATRAVKKIAKSPIGKIALATGIAGIPFGGGKFFGSGSLFGKAKPFLMDSIFGKVTDLGIPGPGRAVRTGGILDKALGFVKDNPFGAITAASAVAGLLTPEQEDQAQQLADNTGIDIEAARNSILQAAKENYAMDVRARGFKADGGRIEYQEGSKEPVAKKTMPLLDMGGMEKDYREDGGFVPIGRMERADDVPARLSKNEFVFTADAVRNAGDGDIDKGAEVMYNMMKNLEAGGEVSEESQGLKGARRMFQTSQRLEEVL